LKDEAQSRKIPFFIFPNFRALKDQTVHFPILSVSAGKNSGKISKTTVEIKIFGKKERKKKRV